MKKSQGEKEKFYRRNWFLWVSLIFLPPLGLVLLWVCHKEKRKEVKVVLSVVFALWFVLIMASPNEESTAARSAGIQQAVTRTSRLGPVEVFEPEETVQATAEPEASAATTPQATATPDPTTTPQATAEPSPSPTPQATAVPDPTPTPQATATQGPTITPQVTATPDSTTTPEQKGSQQSAEMSLDSTAVESNSDVTKGSGTSSGTTQSGGSGNGENFNTYDEPSQQKTTASYVLNTNTKKFHRPGCSSVKKIAPKNYATSSKSRDALISQGYSACKKCNP